MANQVAYGFINLENIFDQRVTTQNFQVIDTAITQSVEEHNRQVGTMMSLFVENVTESRRRYRTPIAVRNQPLDEHGRALPIRRAGFYDVGFPIHDSGQAWGQTFKAKVKQTVAEANELTSTMLSGDARWMRDHVLAGLFTNVAWTFDDDEFGNIVIKGLANNDTDTYLVMSGADLGTVDNHYSAQANAIGAGADDPWNNVIVDELMEHPENGGEVITLFSNSHSAQVRALSGFVPLNDTRINPASTTRTLAADLGVDVPGNVIGFHDKGAWLVEWRSMPANYLLSVTSTGPRPLGLRQHEEAELQGFFKVPTDRVDQPYYEYQYLRYAGFGGNNRVGAHVHRVGNASYAVPTNYTSPMP